MNDIPTAVMSTESRGAFRRRRYATNSIDEFTIAPKAATIRNVEPSPSTIAPVLEASLIPKTLSRMVVEKRPLSAKTSP